MFPTLLLCAALNVGGQPFDMKRAIASEIAHTYHIGKNQAYEYADLALRNSKRYDVPVDIILSIISVESAFRNENKDGSILTSSAGALGAMQIMPSTAQEIARDLHVKEYDIHNLWTNIRFGTYYLHKMHKQFGSWELAIKAYNCGAYNVQKTLAGRSLPRETVQYIISVTHVRDNMQTQMPSVVAQM